MSDEVIQICTDIVLPPDLMVEAAKLAIEENPANAPATNVTPGIGAGGPLPPSFLAVITGKRWLPGRTLRVRFLGGDPVVQRRLQPFAHQWSDFANIKFVFGDDPDAEIRIAFENSGSWSNIGTDALAVPKNRATMNYGWLKPDTPDNEYSRVVIHEFGHALGCIHEHQNPVAEIPWNKEAVYKYYAGPPNNWSRAQVDLNLFQRYSANITQFSAFDKDSIMLYAIPKTMATGGFEVGWNRVLSPSDKEFIATIYPKVQVQATELALDGPVTSASIGKHEEEDLYRFTVPAGKYVVETQGWTNVVLKLCGPDDPARALAEDDNGGILWNARIAAQLAAGTYYARVRHRNPAGTGQYGISVRTWKQ
jgi:hypothetical protein